jgi:hypothetical protein
MPLFLVTNEQGPSWASSTPMRDQKLWTEHAAFVNSLMDAGFVILGGPIGSGSPHRAVLVVYAESEESARRRLLTDPWMVAGILRIGSLEPWKILVSNDKLDPVLAQIAPAA